MFGFYFDEMMSIKSFWCFHIVQKSLIFLIFSNQIFLIIILNNIFLDCETDTDSQFNMMLPMLLMGENNSTDSLMLMMMMQTMGNQPFSMDQVLKRFFKKSFYVTKKPTYQKFRIFYGKLNIQS